MSSLYDLTPGTRVIVNIGGHLGGMGGVVVEMAEGLLNGHDCAVLLNDKCWTTPLCFYSHELKVLK